MYKAIKAKLYLSKNERQFLLHQTHIAKNLYNEAYTSKASYIDNDEIKKETSFSGKRTKRGLYVSKAGIAINADLNVALNILRKCNPESFKIGSIDLNTPKRTYLFSS